jgi:hypothetical protein
MNYRFDHFPPILPSLFTVKWLGLYVTPIVYSSGVTELGVTDFFCPDDPPISGPIYKWYRISRHD